MGFCRAEIFLDGLHRSFILPEAPEPDSQDIFCLEQNIRGVSDGRLVLYAEKDNCSSRRFHLLADIALEAWLEASAHWLETNDAPLTFEAVAKPIRNYSAQKVRNLYRPTY